MEFLCTLMFSVIGIAGSPNKQHITPTCIHWSITSFLRILTFYIVEKYQALIYFHGWVYAQWQLYFSAACKSEKCKSMAAVTVMKEAISCRRCWEPIFLLFMT